MKSTLPAAVLAIALSLSLAPNAADAKRFGGGTSSGMQRSLPAAPPTRPATPPQQAAPTPAPNPGAAPAAAAPKRNWLGPIAGLAAGLGLAALMSHLGLSETFGNVLMLALLAIVAVAAFRLLTNRRPAAATAGASGREPTWEPPAAAERPAAPAILPRTAAEADGGQWSADGSTRLSPLGSSRAPVLPEGFDAEGFARLAKTIFIRLQAANDAGDLNDLRSFTTPEMFAVARLDIQDRGGKPQFTDVVKVDAEVLGLEQEGERQVVSVRFHGQIREEAGGPLNDFDEVWHLVRWGDSPSWAIAGIQQQAATASA